MSHVYDEIGLRRVINASGSMTYLGGSLIAPEVLEKMNQAASAFVVMEELLDWAGGEIARLTGAEAGLVTTGSAGGILLACAACRTGGDRRRMRALPGPEAGKGEFVMQKQHRIGFDYAVGVAGGQIVEVGGAAGTSPADIEAALGPNTAAILHVVLDPQPVVPLEQVAQIAHARGIPVIVDAAAELPPVGNLSAFGAAGGDLVIFSGGKDIAGPNDSGILCGRAELIEAARAQAFPNGGIGRPLKVSKEQVVGLVFALRRFVGLDQDKRLERWGRLAQAMVDGLGGLAGVEADIAYPTRGARPLIIPRARLRIDEGVVGRTVEQIEEELEGGDPAVAVLPEAAAATIWLNPQHLEDGEEAVVVRRVVAVLGGAAK
jgi:L-seryl-tRNA(Ser) seleniumtransferase